MTTSTTFQNHRCSRPRHGGALLTILAVLLLAGPAAAEAPADAHPLSSSRQSAIRAEQFDPAAVLDFNTRPVRVTTAHYHAAILAEMTPEAEPTPATDAHLLSLRAPLSPHANPAAQWLLGPRLDAHDPQHLPGPDDASALVGTLLTQNLELHAGKQPYHPFSVYRDAHRYRDIQRRFDQTRRVLIALYKAGDSVVTAGIIQLTDDKPGLDRVRAEIAPAWVNGGPAAHLRISF